MQCLSIGTMYALLLYFIYSYSVIGALGNENGSGCLETFTPNGTTSATVFTDGKAIARTTINPTPFFAPCDTGWHIARETMTILVIECNETQTRDEPRLTSIGAGGTSTTRIQCLHSPTPTPTPVCIASFALFNCETNSFIVSRVPETRILRLRLPPPGRRNTTRRNSFQRHDTNSSPLAKRILRLVFLLRTKKYHATRFLPMTRHKFIPLSTRILRLVFLLQMTKKYHATKFLPTTRHKFIPLARRILRLVFLLRTKKYHATRFLPMTRHKFIPPLDEDSKTRLPPPDDEEIPRDGIPSNDTTQIHPPREEDSKTRLPPPDEEIPRDEIPSNDTTQIHPPLDEDSKTRLPPPEDEEIPRDGIPSNDTTQIHPPPDEDSKTRLPPPDDEEIPRDGIPSNDTTQIHPLLTRILRPVFLLRTTKKYHATGFLPTTRHKFIPLLTRILRPVFLLRTTKKYHAT